MKVQVRLFAGLAQMAGWQEREIEVTGDASVKSVLAQLRKGPLLALVSTASVLFALNCEHVTPDTPVSEGDEVGLFPPVSGGSGKSSSKGPWRPDRLALLTDQEISAAALGNLLRHPSCGAVVTFEGIVRDQNEGQSVRSIDYQAYEQMALPLLQAIRDEVEERWPGTRLALAHRTGRLLVGEVSVAVACCSPHRREAFAAARLAMDRIKERVPVWKHEESPEGSERWA